MKKTYVTPLAERVIFAKEDVITSSGILNDWNTPTVDVGDSNGDWNWSESEVLTITEKV